MDRKMAERIARTYCEKYKTIGYAAASDYVEQVLGENPLHISQVRELVIQMLNPTIGGTHNED